MNEARHNVTVAEAAIQQAQARIPQAEASIQSALTAPNKLRRVRTRPSPPRQKWRSNRRCWTRPGST